MHPPFLCFFGFFEVLHPLLSSPPLLFLPLSSAVSPALRRRCSRAVFFSRPRPIHPRPEALPSHGLTGPWSRRQRGSLHSDRPYFSWFFRIPPRVTSPPYVFLGFFPFLRWRQGNEPCLIRNAPCFFHRSQGFFPFTSRPSFSLPLFLAMTGEPTPDFTLVSHN